MPTLNEILHSELQLPKGEKFIKLGQPCIKIAEVMSGVLRGYVEDEEGKEVTTHFYQEGDLIIASYIPKMAAPYHIEALTHSVLSVADYAAIMDQVNRDMQLTDIIHNAFQKLNSNLQSRLVSLLNLDSLNKYTLFLEQYPSLINRIPNYYIAQYLGITPTQLSRARKQYQGQN